ATDLRDRLDRTDGRRLRGPAEARVQAGRARTFAADRAAGPQRAGDGAALHAPVAPELCDRPRAVPARQLHDETQSAAEREGGAVAGVRGRSPAPAAGDG